MIIKQQKTMTKHISGDAKQCPWCFRWCLKDNSCNYIFACGLTDQGTFTVGTGCGRSWCFACGKKFCGLYIDPETGKKTLYAKDIHTKDCCKVDTYFVQSEFCCGGHNSHCEVRW